MKSDLWDSNLLKAERKRRGWSQEKVAKALGVDVTTVRRWEAGRVAPYSYHRSKISALFAKSPEELDLLFNEQEEALPIAGSSESAAGASLLADPATSETASSARSLLGHEKLLKQFLSPCSLWHGGLGYIKRLPTLRSPNRSSWYPFLIISTILLVALLTVGVLPPFTRPPAVKPGYSPAPPPDIPPRATEMSYAPQYVLRFSNTDPSVQHIQDVFNAVYAQLVNRFAPDPTSVTQNTVTITFSSDLASSAQASGRTITINPHWIEQHPTQMGLLTHELTLIVEQYPSGAPAWFADGLADYARSLYGPADDDWSLPDGVQPQQSYRQGGAVAARFLLWLELHTRSDIVDQLHQALQKGLSFSTIFRSLTHATTDDLWRQYQIHSDITPTPQQRYSIAISRKPLFYKVAGYPLGLYGTSYYEYLPDAAHTQGFTPSNFAMQADIAIIAGDTGAGFFFRNDDSSWYSVYLFASGDYALDRTYQSQLQPGPLIFNSAIKVGLHQTNRLTIIVQKYSFYLYVNGQFITKVDDTRLLSSGSLGLIRSREITTTVAPDIMFDNPRIF